MQFWMEIWTDINIKNVILIVLKTPKILLELLLILELFLRLPKILSYNFWGNVINVGDDVVVLDDDNTDWTEIQKKVKVIDIKHYIIDFN